MTTPLALVFVLVAVFANGVGLVIVATVCLQGCAKEGCEVATWLNFFLAIDGSALCVLGIASLCLVPPTADASRRPLLGHPLALNAYHGNIEGGHD